MALINGSERLSATLVYLMLILAGDVELNPGPTLDDRPIPSELILLCKAGETTPYVRVKKEISVCANYQDLAELLLMDSTTVAILRNDFQERGQFVNEMFRRWLELNDDDVSSRAAARTWSSLADTIEQADLPGQLAKKIRDVCNSYGSEPKASKGPIGSGTTPPQEQKPSSARPSQTRKEATHDRIMKKLQLIKFPDRLWDSLAVGLSLGKEVENIRHETNYSSNGARLNKVISILTAKVEEPKIWDMLVYAVSHAGEGQPILAKKLAEDPEVDVPCQEED